MLTSPTPDLSEARRLLHYGMHLVPLHRFEKRPYGDDWNAPHKRVKKIDDNATGYGLPLALNKLCSVDPDNWPLAVRGMRALGFDLEAIMQVGVRTKSTRPSSGGRSAFAEEPDLSWLTFRSKDTGTVIEFRAFSPNLQDCVPGVVYADSKGTLREQTYANDNRLEDAPGLPDDLMVWWQRCSTDIAFLNQQETMFFAALDVKPSQSISTGRNGSVLAYAAPGYRGPYNRAHTVESILKRHDYSWHPKEQRWAPPTATGAPAVRPIPNRDGLWQSDHASDPLSGTFDAWIAHVVLDHQGNLEAAIAQEKKRQGTPPPVDPETGGATAWPELADPFAKYPVPAFPVDALPDPFARLCRELSAQSGFDVGGYAFSCLVIASSLIDHRKKMRAGPLSVPAFLWGGLVANSGGGKSPTLNTVARAVRQINDGLVRESQRELAKWSEQLRTAATPEERKSVGPKPLWEQLTASDTTVEALGHLMADNPQGMLLLVDELTGFIGRMDAYSAPGSGKDRAVYLSAWDGGSVTINRASKAPLVVENFSVGIMCGIQPEKLGELFKKSGGGSDGLYQRFLMYAMQPAGDVDYAAELGAFTEVNAANLFNTLHDWTKQGSMAGASLCAEALPLMQAYHQSMRTIAQRTSAKRLAEHLDKYPGFLARVAYALHCMECALRGEYVPTVGLDTFKRAQRIMQVMYHHSVAVYEVLDAQSGDLARLTRAACEAILSQGWSEIKRGDLTRYATDWRDADDRQAESALDYLIELGWIKDITPAIEPGKRGRRSNGLFLVNPAVHQVYTNHTERIKAERSARYAALQTIVGGRNTAY